MQASDRPLNEILFFQLDQCLRQAVRYTHRVFQEKEVNLTKDQWLVLKSVNDEVKTGISLVELCRRLDKEPASMTRMLDILEKKALLIRQPNPSDRRSSILYPTREGKLLFQELLPVVKSIRAQSMHGFSKEEVEQFRSYLSRMTQNMS
ncbi:MAG: MarR family transcriptional regulator [Bacteroidota bacterium]